MRSVIVPSNKAPRSAYPCLKKYTKGGCEFVVLFHAENCGTVVAVNVGGYHLGFHCQSWGEEEFEPFTGKIELISE
ncbi:MAG TPA: hypothetical protein VKT73_12835 [Xanthobacteraceae bacterium]|nr:hypothetical protein [Xanthobacteraceae bacterium]